MKLRALVLLLVLANLGFFAWSQGWLDALGGARAGANREPERIARQIDPQRVHILPATAGAAAVAAPPATATATCLEAGPFGADEADAALAQWRERGVTDARIVPATAPASGAMLRIEPADGALEARLGATGADAAPLGQAFRRCAN